MVEVDYITASDVKRYAFCPKIIYFTHVLHLEERVTEAMEYGSELHKEPFILPIISKVKPVKVYENLRIVSDRFRVVGVPDYILVTRFNEYVPVEVKWAEEAPRGGVKKDHKLQIAVYALLIDDMFKTNVKRGYIYYVRSNKFLEVYIPHSLKVEVLKVIGKIYEIIEKEVEPKVKVPQSRCESCGWRVYCKGAI